MGYAGDGKFSFQADVYDAVSTEQMISRWLNATGRDPSLVSLRDRQERT